MDTLAELYFRFFAIQKWGWEQDNEPNENDDVIDNIIKVKYGEPTGDASEDYKLYREFINNPDIPDDIPDLVGALVTYPGLNSAIFNKIMHVIADFLEDSEDYKNLTLEEFENQVWVQEYFNIFPGLQVIFQTMIDPPSPPPLRRASIVPGGDGGKNLNKFLNEQPVRVLKMIIKNSGYTGYSKLKKKQLVSFIKNKL